MKRVLITGGNKGIGYQITKELIENNFYVVCLARSFDDFNIQHKNLETVSFDLSNIDRIGETISKIGEIDILINNAGYMTACDHLDYPSDERDNMINVNLIAPVELIKATLPSMINNKWGRIINIASLAGKIGHPDIWYGITKAGMINVGVSLSKLLKNTGVKINAISPGPVNTKMMKTVPEARKENLREKLLVTGEYLDPSKIAKVVLWLCSEENDAITGQSIEINDAIVWK